MKVTENILKTYCIELNAYEKNLLNEILQTMSLSISKEAIRVGTDLYEELNPPAATCKQEDLD